MKKKKTLDTVKVSKEPLTKMEIAIKVLRRDEKYRKLKDTFATHENFRIPIEELLDELKSSHQIRKVRRLNSTDPHFVDKVIEATLDDQAKRSRATEILVRCVRSHGLMFNALESLRYHLLLTYGAELRHFRTKEERVQVVNAALKNFVVYLNNIAALKETAQLVSTDIDKAGWNLKLVVETMKLHMSREVKL